MPAASAIFEVRLDRLPAPDDVARLYREVGWLEESGDAAFIPAMLAGSLLVASAWRHGEFCGMARALSDGASDACIQDVAVFGKFRRNGVGRALVSELADALEARGIDFIELIAVAGTTDFYRSCGFSPMPGATPMRRAPAGQPPAAD